MGTIANAKVTHYYNCYNGDFIGCLRISCIWILRVSIPLSRLAISWCKSSLVRSSSHLSTSEKRTNSACYGGGSISGNAFEFVRAYL